MNLLNTIHPFLALECPASPSYAHAVPESLKRVQSRPDIQEDGYIIVLCWLTAIVVNDVANLSPTSLHYPVMSVKWQLVPARVKKRARERETDSPHP